MPKMFKNEIICILSSPSGLYDGEKLGYWRRESCRSPISTTKFSARLQDLTAHLTSLLLLLGKVQCKGRSLKKWNLFKSVRVSRVVWNAAEVNWKCVTLLICHRLIIHVLVTFNNFQMRMGSMRERGGIH